MKNIIVSIFIKFIGLCLKLVGRKREILQNKLLDEFIPLKTVTTKYGPLSIYCLGNTSIWRADTFHTKEPETLNWIDDMNPNETLWDVGANIGLYSLYAAKKGMSVFSFEPSTNNTFLLYKNIILNGLSDKIRMMPFAVSDHFLFGKLNLTSLENGSAFNVFNSESLDQIQSEELTFKTQFTQGMIGFSIDELVFEHKMKCPDHLKVDVDSIEEKIIIGASKTLAQGSIKSILIELTDGHAETDRIINYLSQGGLKHFSKHQSELMKDSEANHHYNYIFTRH